MSQFQTKPENEAKRLRAFELHLTASMDGKKRSIRSIAQELGVALSTVQYWRDQDGWERRVREALLTTARSADLAAAHAKMAIRDGLLKSLQAMHDVLDKGTAREKVAAARAMAEIASRFQALDPSSLLAGKPEDIEFEDDLPAKETDADLRGSSSAGG